MLDSVYTTIYGKVLRYDARHDEVYIEGTGLVVLVNGRWLYSYGELLELVKEEL